MALGQRPHHTDSVLRLREMSNVASYVLLERLHLESRIAAERRCKDNHLVIANQCTYDYKIRQARDHTAEETNVSHVSLDPVCSLHLPVSTSNLLKAKRLSRTENHSCAQLCTHDSFDRFMFVAVGIFHSSLKVPLAATRE